MSLNQRQSQGPAKGQAPLKKSQPSENTACTDQIPVFHVIVKMGPMEIQGTYRTVSEANVAAQKYEEHWMVQEDGLNKQGLYSAKYVYMGSQLEKVVYVEKDFVTFNAELKPTGVCEEDHTALARAVAHIRLLPGPQVLSIASTLMQMLPHRLNTISLVPNTSVQNTNVYFVMETFIKHGKTAGTKILGAYYNKELADKAAQAKLLNIQMRVQTACINLDQAVNSNIPVPKTWIATKPKGTMDGCFVGVQMVGEKSNCSVIECIHVHCWPVCDAASAAKLVEMSDDSKAEKTDDSNTETSYDSSGSSTQEGDDDQGAPLGSAPAYN